MKQFFLIATVSVVLFSCSGKSDSAALDYDVDSTTMEVNNLDSSMLLISGTILPSPMQIANIYQKAGLKYIDGIANDPIHQSKYTSTISKSLNLGVYTADLAYCILNDQTQSALLYLKVIKQLSEGAGLSGIFESQAMLSRFEKNIGNKDSLTQIMLDFNSESDFFFEENDKQTQSLIIFTGGFVESFYIASVVGLSQKNEVVISRLVEQKLTLDKLVSILTLISKNEPELKNITEDLLKIKTLLNNSEAIKSKDANTIDYTKIKLTQNELQRIADAAKKLRTRIVAI